MLVIFILAVAFMAAAAYFFWLLRETRRDPLTYDPDPAETAVPVSDLSEFRTAGKTEPAVVQPVSEDSVAAPQSAEAAVQASKVAVGQDLSAELPFLNEGTSAPASPSVENEGPSPAVRALREELKQLREKAVTQARNAMDVIAKLREVNERQREELEAAASSNAAVQDRAVETDALMHLKAECLALKDALRDKDAHLRRFRDEAADARAELEREMAGSRQAMARMEEELAGLKTAAAPDTGVPVSEDLARLRSEYQHQLDHFYNQIEQLTGENQRLKAEAREAVQVHAERLRAATLSSGNGEWLEQKNQLESRLRELEAVNSIQEEKNGFLQYELTKVRAQASGMDRVVENSRRQIEELNRQMTDAVRENAELRRKAGLLGQTLEEFKRTSGEMLREGRLARFEADRLREEHADEPVASVLCSRISGVLEGDGAERKNS